MVVTAAVVLVVAGVVVVVSAGIVVVVAGGVVVVVSITVVAVVGGEVVTVVVVAAESEPHALRRTAPVNTDATNRLMVLTEPLEIGFG